VRHQSQNDENPAACKSGLENLTKHVENLRKFHLPTVVGLNRFTDDSNEDLRRIKDFSIGLGVECAVVDAFDQGGAGTLELAEKVVAAADTVDLDLIQPIYSVRRTLEDKISLVAREIYGAHSVDFAPAARKKLEQFSALGFSELPICMAKTQYSLSDDPKKLGAPKDWTLAVTDAHLASGAGFIIGVAGNMMLMPGLPKSPQALRMHLNEDGSIAGLY
jgi:formate--tetrahydrofolate ligase